MLARRIIPCLDVKCGRVVKGVRFRDHRDVGDIGTLAKRYRDEGADEVVFYDITASPRGERVSCAWISRVAKNLDIPFCVAGGIRSVADAGAVLRAGADKVSVNTPALERPELINELAVAFGRQCVVVGVDSRRINGDWFVHVNAGDTASVQTSSRRTLDWLREVQDRGAGEIVLNCMDSDGVRAGYDLEQIAAVRARCHVPLVASGGAGAPEHFLEALQHGADAALAASVFHSGEIAIPTLKAWLGAQGIEVRPC